MNYIKENWVKLGIGILVGLLLVYFARGVFASQTPYKTICHHTPANNVTLNFMNLQSWLGHLGTPHSGSTYDTNGACVVPTVQPTVVPTIQPTATPTPTNEPECEEQCEPTPTPAEEPEVTPTPRVTDAPTPYTSHDEVLTNNTTQTPGVCIPRQMHDRPSIWGVGRIDSDTVYGNITKTEDYITQYVVWYGLWEGDFRWNTTVGLGYFELNGVPNTHIWMAGQSTDGCGTGPLGTWIDP